jgi:hypothetical protein
MTDPDVAQRQADAYAKLTEPQLIAAMARLTPDPQDGISRVRQIELEMQRRAIVASRELKAASDGASSKLFWLTVALTGFTVVLAVLAVLQLIALHFFG